MTGELNNQGQYGTYPQVPQVMFPQPPAQMPMYPVRMPSPTVAALVGLFLELERFITASSRRR